MSTPWPPVTPGNPVPDTVPDPPELTDAERTLLAAQLAAQAARTPDVSVEQAATAAQMTQRGPALPAESDMDKLMAALKEQSEQIAALQGQVGVMQKQADERALATGGPPVIRYAQAAAAKLAATAVAHPDLGPDHFAVPLAAAEQLLTAATALSKDGSDPAGVENAAGKLRRWLDVTHHRTSGKYIDMSALRDDIETAVDEAAKLAA